VRIAPEGVMTEKRRRGRPIKVVDEATRADIIDAFRHGTYFKDIMSRFRLSYGVVQRVRDEAVQEGLLDRSVLVRVDMREAARRAWETKRAKYDVSQMMRKAARTRIERGHHWTQVLTSEERSERSRKAARTLRRRRMMEHATNFASISARS
jgi:hypothetical protein